MMRCSVGVGRWCWSVVEEEWECEDTVQTGEVPSVMTVNCVRGP
jgi:hypothetical protein